MNEKPIEWMSVIGETPTRKALKVISYILALAAAVFYMLDGNIFAMIVAAVFIVLAIVVTSRSYVEYEMCYFSEDIDVSIIYNRARRKKKTSFTLTAIEYAKKKVDPQDNPVYYCKKDSFENVYTLIVNKDGKREAMVMELDPAFIKVLEMKRKIR